MESMIVCKICFAWKEHERQPILTPESKAVYNPREKVKTCPVCNHEWSSIRVVREINGRTRSRWVRLRNRPPIPTDVDYKLCKNLPKCPKGQQCTHAHSQTELLAWVKQRAEQEPRPPPQLPTPANNGPRQYQLCRKFNVENVLCSVRCRFAHSTQELEAWEQSQIRIPRMLNIPTDGYRLCWHIESGKRCLYGEFCTFAHSLKELQEWNQRLQRAYAENQDFASLLRTRLSSDYKELQHIQGFEDTKNHVTIVEVSGHEPFLRWSRSANVQWTFEISNGKYVQLQSVVLFDMLATDFTIRGVWAVKDGCSKMPISGKVSLQGAGIELNHIVKPPWRVHVKISLKPRSGILGQLVLFSFGSFYMIRPLGVHFLSDQEKRLLENSNTPLKKEPKKPDLFWEQRYRIFGMPDSFQEEVDDLLPLFPLPEHSLDEWMKDSKYNGVLLNEDHYTERMHRLLFLEEYQQRLDMSRYDLHDIEIDPKDHYEINPGKPYQFRSGMSYSTPIQMRYPPPGYWFIEVIVDEVLFEGRRSIRPGDGALLRPANQYVAHECYVEHVGREWIILKITDKAKQQTMSSKSHGRCSIRFNLIRVPLQAMHYAVDKVEVGTIFPATKPAVTQVDTPPSIKECLKILEKLQQMSHVSPDQQNAIASMVDPKYTQVPSLVLGPCGCGKTYTLIECAKMLALNVPETCLLICTLSNSAADLYVEKMNSELERHGKKELLLRLYHTNRRFDTVPDTVLEYCRIQNRQFVMPSLDQLQQYRIIVTTLYTARVLSLLGLQKGHFTHIFIDEAAQALEAESLVPLCLADKKTKIVLAGDHMQMEPAVYSPKACECGLQVSLLERLYDHDIYTSEGPMQSCKTLLTENRRSHSNILDVPSKLFYKKQLKCVTKLAPDRSGPKDIPAIKFIGVDGHEWQDKDSPSFYNDHEAIKIVQQVQLLVSKGLYPEEVCVLAFYSKQVRKIRNMLRGVKKHKLANVTVTRVNDVQGKEFRALLLSTVRTCTASTYSNTEKEEGFLSNAKLFNTAITRAREWLIVVGHPVTLCTVGSNSLCWMELIRKCHQLGTFEYPCAAKFEEFLGTRLVSRQILEKSSKSSFFGMVEDSSASSSSSTSSTDISETIHPDNQQSVAGNDQSKTEASKIKAEAESGSSSMRPPSQDEYVIDNDLIIKKKDIGAGAFGNVFEGRLGDQPCAVKILHSHVLQLFRSLEPTVQEEALQRFLEECKILERFQHPNVVRHLSSRTDPQSNLPILVMELMDESLTHFLEVMKNSSNPLSLHTEASLSFNIASALLFLHSKNIVHRDLCSDNVLLLRTEGTPIAKISDFGMSKILDPDHCKSLTTLGHREAHLPPEARKIASRDYDSSLDIFSFGVVVVQIVTKSNQIIRASDRDALIEQIEETHPLCSLIHECVQLEKEKRPNAMEICRDLETKLGVQ